MQISLLNLALLCIPFALGANWYLESLKNRQVDPIPFSITQMQKRLDQKKTVLVLCLPQTSKKHCAETIEYLNHSPIKRFINDQRIMLMKCEYTPYTKHNPDQLEAVRWALLFGQYDEPSIILLNSNPGHEALHYSYDADDIVEFLGIDVEAASWEEIYFYSMTTAIILLGAYWSCIRLWPRKSPDNNALI